MIFSKSYSEMKQIIDNNNLYFNYEDSPLDVNGNGIRTIITSRSSDVTYVCQIPIQTNAAQGSDQEDFDLNYASRAGERTYVHRSLSFDVTSDGYSYDFKLKANDDTTDIEAFVYKGMLSVGPEAQRGDYVVVSIVDVDNLFGFGAGTVLGYMVRKKILSGGKEAYIIDPPRYDYLSSKRKVLNGLYVRVSYHGTGRPNVICDIEYEY